MNFASCCGSAFCSTSKLAISVAIGLALDRANGRLSRAEGTVEHLPRVVDSALNDILLSYDHLVELFQNYFRLRGTQMLHLRDSLADALHFLLVQMLQYFGAVVFSQSGNRAAAFSHSGK